MSKSVEGVAFESAAEAWFWTATALRARIENSSASRRGVKRPCDPDDVVRCLDRLYRSRRIDLRHARVLRAWGERQRAPDPEVEAGQEARLWREALTRLEGSLRSKGIVA